MDYKCRDKFLVQTVLISAAQELPNVAAIVSCYVLLVDLGSPLIVGKH